MSLDLTKISTRQLLAMLRWTYPTGGYYDLSEGSSDPIVYADDLRAELAKREHILNKKEGEALRRNKQKSRNSRGRRDK